VGLEAVVAVEVGGEIVEEVVEEEEEEEVERSCVAMETFWAISELGTWVAWG